MSDRAKLKAGLWRGEIFIDEIAIPFHFDVVPDKNAIQVFYINGPERMRVEEVIHNGNEEVTLNFPSYSSSIKAGINNEVMLGVASFKRFDGIKTFDFRAEYGKTFRFFAEPSEQPLDFSGTWKADVFYSDSAQSLEYTANLKQEGNSLSGCFEGAYGDSRFLAGQVYDDEFFLSMHDGGLLQRWHAKRQKDGSLLGKTTNLGFAETPWKASFTGYTNPPEPAGRDTLNAGVPLEHGSTLFDFSLPDLSGNLISPGNKKYSGKVVIVILAASWCPTCHDHAAFFAPYYQLTKDRGLEAISLMFESSGVWEDEKDQVIAFRNRYQIEYDMVFAGDQQSRNNLIPELKQISSFPTLIIVDAMGTVRKVWPGFSGPATGTSYQNYIRDFKTLVEKLLSESPA